MILKKQIILFLIAILFSTCKKDDNEDVFIVRDKKEDE